MAEKPVMAFGLDHSIHSFYALEWILEHFFNHPPSSTFKLLIVHAKSAPSSVIGFSGREVAEAIPFVEEDLNKAARKITQRALEMCRSKSVEDVRVEVVEGEAKNVLCNAVEKHHASILVLGSHCYGTFKRAVLGSVSNYCSNHAHCSVLIVKRPRIKH